MKVAEAIFKFLARELLNILTAPITCSAVASGPRVPAFSILSTTVSLLSFTNLPERSVLTLRLRALVNVAFRNVLATVAFVIPLLVNFLTVAACPTLLEPPTKVLAAFFAAVFAAKYVPAPTAVAPPVAGVSKPAPKVINPSTIIGATCSPKSCMNPISTPKIPAIALLWEISFALLTSPSCPHSAPNIAPAPYMSVVKLCLTLVASPSTLKLGS